MVNYIVLVAVVGCAAAAVVYLIGFGQPPPTVAEVLRAVDKEKQS